MILDVFGRYAVGWTVQQRESAELAKALIAQATEQKQIGRDQLTIHADRGSSMTSTPVAFLLADLGVLKTTGPTPRPTTPTPRRSSRRSSTGLGSRRDSTRSSTRAASAASSSTGTTMPTATPASA